MLEVAQLLPFSVIYDNNSSFCLSHMGFLSFAGEIVLIQGTWGPTISVQELK